MTNPDSLLSIRLSVDYRTKPGVLRDLTLQMRAGEILGLVGESGCGKSTLAMGILRLLDHKRAIARGQVIFQGEDLLRKNERELRAIRGKQISVVLQSPLTALNPALRIGIQLREAWRAHATGSRAESLQAIRGALENVCLPADDEFLSRRPSQLSVGQAQRVIIAMGILHRPALLIADEATSALDTITQGEILELFGQLNRQMGTAILYISHDLMSVAALCHRIAILRAGEIVECGTPEVIFGSPSQDYTRRLIAALPSYPQGRISDKSSSQPPKEVAVLATS